MIKDEALKLGLEALEGFIPYLPLKDGAQCNRYDKAIAAIKEALAQPEQEPVLWMMPDGKTVDKWALQFYGGQVGKPLYTTPPALAQPEQEFVAWEQFYPDIGKPQIAINPKTVGYVAPQRTWVGLTDEEKHEIRYSHMTSAEFIEFIEAKLKEKNNV